MRYAWIKQPRDSFPIRTMCRILNVSTSGFYDSLDVKPSQRALRSKSIKAHVLDVYKSSHGIYGSAKISQEMRNSPERETACRNTVAKAMREMGLKSCVSKKFRPTTTVADPSRQAATNSLNQEFKADGPNQKWVADITYLPTSTGWIYLAVVLDLYSRKVVGWAISNSLQTTLITEALRQAIERRRPATNKLLHHSDRGCQYTSEAFQGLLKTMQITCSMSRTGCCYDNAVAERFFWSLKHEWTNYQTYRDLEEAKRSVFKYIELFYNPIRLHQTLNYLSPEEFERKNIAQIPA